MSSVDNPNYFDVEASPKSPQSPSRSFFLFKKKSSSNKSMSLKPKLVNQSKNIELPPIGKRRGSFKCLLRSRSNSTSTPQASPTINVNHQDNIIECKITDYGPKMQFRERIGSYNESVSYSGNDDVFDGPSNNSKYDYNNSSQYSNSLNASQTSSGTRRHSIGTFMNKEKIRTSSITDEVPKMPAPKAPTSTTRSKDCRKYGDNMSTMDDILIVTARQSEPGILWVNYLKACFDKITKQRGRLPFNFLHIKIDEEQITPQLMQRCLSTKLQIVVICPTLLSLPPQFLLAQFSSILKPERVLGMLLDVTEERVWEVHKAAFPSYKQWRRCIVRNQDQSFVSDLLGIATDILGRALRQQPLCTDTTPSNSKPLHSCHDSFTIFPRKVKIGQNKVIVILTEPLIKDDWIKIKVEKTGQIIEITNIKRRNPFTIQFNIPECCMEVSMMIGIRLEKNNDDMGCRPLKCESRLRELEQILKSNDAPMEFMCQSIGIASSDREKLDLYLVQSFQKNIPPKFHLLNTPEPKNGYRLHREAHPEEYPTLLHFAAKWGLERLCLQLLDCPGGDVACEMRNICCKTPAELADTSGHYKLAQNFKNFAQMNEFTTLYHHFKEISDASPNKTLIEPKPSSSKQATITAVPDSPKLSKLSRKEHQDNEGYMEMNGSGSDINETSSNSIINSVSNLNYLNIDNSSRDEVDYVVEKEKESEKDKEILNNLNNTGVSEVMFSELRITEPVYFESNELNKTDEFSQECSNLLENCNSMNSSDSDYLIQPSNIPVPSNVSSQDFGDYLTHPSNIPIEQKPLYNNINYNSDYQNTPSNKKLNINREAEREISHLRLTFKKKDDDTKSKSGTLKRQGSNTSKKSVDDELLEIITDFKNNVFTIAEVEQLVASWKNRNDVKKSFKDKQEQLQKMREEYERIQHQMRENLKRPTPFERMKKIFTRSKSQQQKENKNLPELSDPCDEIKFSMLQQSGHRPISTLSLHSVSSGSSGRMSTGSVCSGASLGDSGTHSDHEERRHIYNSSACRVGNPGSLMDNYMIPPAPRPVITPTTTPTPVEENDRPFFSHHHSNSRISTPTESSEHYILFPSNIPVFPTQDTSNDYINIPSTLKTIDETKETDAAVSVHPIKIQKSDVIYSQLDRRTPNMSSFKTSQKFSINKSDEMQNNIEILNQTIKECNDSLNELQNIQVPEQSIQEF